VDTVVAGSAHRPRDPDADRRAQFGGVRAHRPFLPAGGPPGRLRSQGLLGPQGTGFFRREGVPIVPLIRGGDGEPLRVRTASRSSSLTPSESGTRNSVGVAARRLPCVDPAKGRRTIRRGEVALVDLLLHGMSRIPGVTVYGPADPARRGSAVSFRVEGWIRRTWGRGWRSGAALLVRAGLHCSPNGHRALGPSPRGPCA